jgi:hypothetical protein
VRHQNNEGFIMNLFQLVAKQMRQRALSTWMTMLSVLLGVALAIAIMILHREGQQLFAQTDFGFDIILVRHFSLR